MNPMDPMMIIARITIPSLNAFLKTMEIIEMISDTIKIIANQLIEFSIHYPASQFINESRICGA